MRIVLTNNAKFNPYTFDEMLKPLAMATDAYNNVQSNLAELGAKADLMRMYANEVPGSKAADMYNSYASDLERQADMLAKHGLSPMSRQGLLDMKRRYSSEIVPIETAVKRREALADEQRKAMLSDSSLMFDRDYSSTPIDYLLENPGAFYASVSGDALTKRASQMASALMKTIQDRPEYRSILGGQYFQQMQQMGYTPDQIMQTILDDENAPQELRNIVDTVYRESGLDKWSDPVARERGRGYINAGLYDGIGTPKYDTVANRNFESDADRSRRIILENQAKDAKEAKEEERKGYLLDNGDRVKPIGAGRVLVTHPDGKYEVVTSSTNSDSDIPKKIQEKRATFTFLEYKKKNFEGKVRSYNVFDTADAKPIKFSQLTSAAQRRLIKDLAEYGYTPDDVDIWWDNDPGFWNADHYRVVLKGTDIWGLDPVKQEQYNEKQKEEAAAKGEEVANDYDQDGLKNK